MSLIDVAYRCCEHCLDDPQWHEENEPDTHDQGCGFAGCVGERRVR